MTWCSLHQAVWKRMFSKFGFKLNYVYRLIGGLARYFRLDKKYFLAEFRSIFQFSIFTDQSPIKVTF